MRKAIFVVASRVRIYFKGEILKLGEMKMFF